VEKAKRAIRRIAKKSAKSWAGRLKSQYLEEVNKELKAQYEDPINALFGFLDGDDASAPCESSGMTTR